METIPDRLRRPLGRALFILALLLGPSLLAAQEFWLSPGPGTSGGSGTEKDPWVTPTATEFDTRMREIPSDSRIHLGPGVFETHGWGSPGQQGFIVKSRWTVEGAGIGKTTVRLVGCIFDQHPDSGVGRMFFSGWGPAVEQVVLRDFTADCNHPGVIRAMKRKSISLEAINLMGRELRVERVHAIRAIGERGAPGVNPEAFIIAVSPRDDTTDATGYFVEDCKVSDFGGGACSAIVLLGKGGKNGSTGAFRRNQIMLGGTGGEFGFNAYGTRDFVIEQNTTRGTARAFNWDTPAPGRDLLIRSNQFLECTGWALNLGGGGDSRIERNLIELAHPNAVGVQISAANQIFPGARAWMIRDNVLRVRSGSATAVRFYDGKAVPGCVFENNRLQGRLKVDSSAKGFSVWRNNRDGSNRAVSANR